MGSLLAARLTQAGQDVYLLARDDHLVDLRQNGIRLQNMLTGQQENVKIKIDKNEFRPGEI
ncbi:MAG: 2-dehydropantoate 2-reductase [Anaerolineales bacterium]|nr:2-dehydropantoate 2-reductase [Anaerolineales bacterium]